MVKKDETNRNLVIVFIYLILAIAFAYIVATQFSSLKNSIKLIGKSNIKDELAALLLIVITFLSSAQSYFFLAFKKLKLGRTIIIEFAVSAINRILPSGVGGLATNYVYLRKTDHSREQAAAVVAINNLLGLVANLFLLSIIVLFVKSNPLIIGRPNNRDVIIIVVVLSLIAFFLIASESLRRRTIATIKNIIKELKTYRHRPDSLLFSFITQISLCFANVLALYFSLQAVHTNLSLSSVMLAFSFAIWLGAVLPTPGGIGAVETGLTGALIAFGIKFDTALSGVLIFRLISFWLPFLIGGPALIWARKRKYL